jgi:hypothetical protein
MEEAGVPVECGASVLRSYNCFLPLGGIGAVKPGWFGFGRDIRRSTG